MQYSKFQIGRSMLEMLAVLAIIGILSIGGLAGFKMAMDHHKANNMLDYMDRVFLAVKSHGEDDTNYAPPNSNDPDYVQGEPNGFYSCEQIIPNMPEFIYSCGVNKVCMGNGRSCVTNVFAYFQEGERGAAAALENKLGMTVRDKRPNLNRLFQKSDCVDDKPISCSFGFAPCAAIGEPCSLDSREFEVGERGSANYYTDAGCEKQNPITCKVWPEQNDTNTEEGDTDAGDQGGN